MSQERHRYLEYDAEITTDHPLLLKMYRRMKRKQVTAKKLAYHTGVAPATIRNWGQGNSPRLFDFERAMNSLGYQLVAVETAAISDSQLRFLGLQNTEPKTPVMDWSGR